MTTGGDDPAGVQSGGKAAAGPAPMPLNGFELRIRQIVRDEIDALIEEWSLRRAVSSSSDSLSLNLDETGKSPPIWPTGC